MKNKNYILQELMEISPIIAKIGNINVYTVSTSYFDDLPEKIIKGIKLYKEHAYNFPSSTPYSIPEDYFANFPKIILQKVVTYQGQANEVFEEMEEIAPLLNTISKKQVYSIPPGFFDKIEIPAGRIKKQESKVVSINRWSKFSRLSAAAVITSLLAVGVYTITGISFTTYRNRNAKNEVKNLSKEEIVNFLKSTSSENVTSAYKNKSKNENAIKSSLKEISDKEIQQFLKETGESDEI